MGCVARLSEQKGLAFLIEALPEILQTVPGAHLLLVGDGPLRPELEGLQSRVSLFVLMPHALQTSDTTV